MLKKIKKPATSLIATNKTLPAKAGSILSLVNIIGIKVPAVALNIKLNSKDTPKTILNNKLLSHTYVIKDTTIAQIKPFKKPVSNSLLNKRYLFSFVI